MSEKIQNEDKRQKQILFCACQRKKNIFRKDKVAGKVISMIFSINHRNNFAGNNTIDKNEILPILRR